MQNELRASLLIFLPWSVTAIFLVALALSLLPMPEGFWLPSDPPIWIATKAPRGRLYLAIGAVLCFVGGGVAAYYRTRFEEQRRTRPTCSGCGRPLE